MLLYGSAINVRRKPWEGRLMMFPVTRCFQVLLLQESGMWQALGSHVCSITSASPTALTIGDLSPLPRRRVNTDIPHGCDCPQKFQYKDFAKN